MQCDQLVTIDNCCNPSQCENQAASHHAASGLSLCAQHYGNAVKFCIDGSWNVAGKQLPFPEGWVTVEEGAETTGASMLTSGEQVRASGLVIETGTLSPSGLVIER